MISVSIGMVECVELFVASVCARVRVCMGVSVGVCVCVYAKMCVSM